VYIFIFPVFISYQKKPRLARQNLRITRKNRLFLGKNRRNKGKIGPAESCGKPLCISQSANVEKSQKYSVFPWVCITCIHFYTGCGRAPFCPPGPLFTQAKKALLPPSGASSAFDCQKSGCGHFFELGFCTALLISASPQAAAPCKEEKAPLFLRFRRTCRRNRLKIRGRARPPIPPWNFFDKLSAGSKTACAYFLQSLCCGNISLEKTHMF